MELGCVHVRAGKEMDGGFIASQIDGARLSRIAGCLAILSYVGFTSVVSSTYYFNFIVSWTWPVFIWTILDYWFIHSDVICIIVFDRHSTLTHIVSFLLEVVKILVLDAFPDWPTFLGSISFLSIN